RGLVERLLHDVGRPRVAVALGHREAATVDGDRVAEADVGKDVLGVEGEPQGIPLVLDPGDRAELFDDPGEHQRSPGLRVNRTLGCSPSSPGSTVTSVTTGRNASAMVVIPRSATAGRPAPSRTGATEATISSTSPAVTNVAARVGPPSRKTCCRSRAN